MNTVTETFQLEDILERNAVDARWFLPFTVYRLQSLADEREVVFKVELKNMLSESLTTRYLKFTWKQENELLDVPPVQQAVITEWAACGIACAVVPLYTNLQVLQVTQVGDRFDYWVGNDSQEFGLEISGTLAGALGQRQRKKASQLLDSPHKVAGYVCVVSFQEKHIILSFHE